MSLEKFAFEGIEQTALDELALERTLPELAAFTAEVLVRGTCLAVFTAAVVITDELCFALFVQGVLTDGLPLVVFESGTIIDTLCLEALIGNESR